MNGKIPELAALLLFLPLFSFASDYPRIPRLDSLDPVFKQFSDDLSAARKAVASSNPGEKLPLHLYSYAVTPNDTLFTIAARTNIPYDAIASLNRIKSIQENLQGKILLLPTLPGIYLPDKAENHFESMLLSSFDPDTPRIITFICREEIPLRKGTYTKRTVHCIPDTLFDGTVRLFFLTPSFLFPLPSGTVSSSFGMRKNPVTGNLVFHHGVDIAAPRGTPVLSCASGIVSFRGFDPVYGNYVTIRHDNSRESLYGHLESIEIELHEKVNSGTILGRVGSTGQSTGPHLHFEMHENGVPKDPSGFIKRN